MVSLIAVIGSTFVWSEGLNSGIEGYWAMNASTGTNVVNQLGNTSRDGTFINMEDSDWVTGIIGNGIATTNTDERVNMSFPLDTASGTISLWYFVNNTASEDYILGGNNGGNTLGDFFLRKSDDSGEKLLTWSVESGAATASFNSDVHVVVGNWVHIVVTWDGADYKMYVNASVQSGAASIANAPSIPQWWIGGRWPSDFGNTLTDELGWWDRVLTQAEITRLYNDNDAVTYRNSNFLSDIFLRNPNSTVFNISAPTSINYNNGSSAIRCWYSFNNGTTNSTNIQCQSANFTIGAGNVTDGLNTWSVYSNNTNGSTRDWVTFTWNSFVINATAFNDTVFETDLQPFVLNVTTNGSTLSSGELIYNGNVFPGTVTNPSGNFYQVERSITIPADVNLNNFTFNFTIGGREYATGNRQQTVIPLNFTQCDATFTTTYLNITFQDEVNQSNISATIPASDFVFHIAAGDSQTNKSTTFVNNTANTYYQFCNLPGNKTIDTRVNIQYAGVNYAQRSFTQNLDLTSTITKKILYLLKTTDGIFVTFQVINPGEQPISGVDVTANRTISGSVVTVGKGVTGDDGGVTFFLNPDFPHVFTFVKIGFDNVVTTITPTQSAYTVIMGTQSNTTVFDYTQGMSFNVTPTTNSLTNDTLTRFAFNLSSTVWTVQRFGFQLTNGTIIYGSNSSTGSAGGIVNFDLNTSKNSTIVMNYFWLVNNTFSNYTYTWAVLASTATDTSVANLFTNVNTFVDEGSFGIGNFGVAIFTFILIFVSTGILSSKFGLVSPAAVSGFLFFLVVFLNVGIGLIPNINGVPFATIFMGIIFAALLIKEVNR